MSNRFEEAFVLKYGSIKYELPSMHHELRDVIFDLRERFHRTLADSEVDKVLSTPPELAGRFLGYVASKVEPHQQNKLKVVLRYLFRAFNYTVLGGLDPEKYVYSLLKDANLDKDPIASGRAKENIIKSFYIAVVNGKFPIAKTEIPGISIFAVFGGQGNSQYFPCLLELHKLYGVFIYEQLLLPISTILDGLIQSDSSIACAYPQGLDILNWLENPEQAPDQDYLLSAPVSCPLLALTQLADYSIECKKCGATPGEYISGYAGTTGRSQSLVTAVAAALSGSWEAFYENAAKAVCIMVYIGSRTHLTYSRNIVDSEDAFDNWVTPMLMIGDLSLDQVQYCVNEANRYLPIEKYAAISLVNSPTNVVVSGPPEPLSRLCGILLESKERMAQETTILEMFSNLSGNLETLVPSEGRSMFWFTYLPIYVPLHSKHLNDSYEQIMQDITQAGIEFSSEDIQIPVYDTYTGDNLQYYDCTVQEYSLTSWLVKLILEKPVNWQLAANFNKSLNLTAVRTYGLPDIHGFSNLR